VDVRSVLETVLDGMEPTAQARSIALERELEPGATRAMADGERLQQVFWNMLSNAIKFTPPQGRVRATLRCADGWIEVAVSDTGKGIAPEFLPHVFESFRQEEGRVSRAEGGLGLGMSITRQLVELHGGSISAHSDGPGKGATFTLRLPVVETTDCGRALRTT
jgi:signal transduction histidine kinase